MNDDSGINMAFCPTCGALPHQPCDGTVVQPWRETKRFHRAVPHWDRQMLGGPRGGRRQR